MGLCVCVGGGECTKGHGVHLGYFEKMTVALGGGHYFSVSPRLTLLPYTFPFLIVSFYCLRLM